MNEVELIPFEEFRDYPEKVETSRIFKIVDPATHTLFIKKRLLDLTRQGLETEGTTTIAEDSCSIGLVVTPDDDLPLRVYDPLNSWSYRRDQLNDAVVDLLILYNRRPNKLEDNMEDESESSWRDKPSLL